MLWDNVTLRRSLAQAEDKVAKLEEKSAADAKLRSWATPAPRSVDDGMTGTLGQGPSLPAPVKESRMARRARMTQMMMDLLGRSESESDEDYKARVQPLIAAGMAKPRRYAQRMRTQAEEAAGVSAEQSAELDKLLSDAQSEVLAYANQAISSGQVSPYERDIAGLLEFAGGLSPILKGAQARIGQVLKPEQMKAMYDSGFEWAEYLGMMAPWESIEAPPARPR